MQESSCNYMSSGQIDTYISICCLLQLPFQLIINLALLFLPLRRWQTSIYQFSSSLKYLFMYILINDCGGHHVPHALYMYIYTYVCVCACWLIMLPRRRSVITGNPFAFAASTFECALCGVDFLFKLTMHRKRIIRVAFLFDPASMCSSCAYVLGQLSARILSSNL